jgi:hypothetical protein
MKDGWSFAVASRAGFCQRSGPAALASISHGPIRNERRVAHISLVFREIWDSTNLGLRSHYREFGAGCFPQAQRFRRVHASVYKKVSSCANITARFQCK